MASSAAPGSLAARAERRSAPAGTVGVSENGADHSGQLPRTAAPAPTDAISAMSRDCPVRRKAREQPRPMTSPHTPPSSIPSSALMSGFVLTPSTRPSAEPTMSVTTRPRIEDPTAAAM